MKETKRTIALCGAAIWAAWLALGIFNLWRGDISRVTYGCCLFVALHHIAFYYRELWERWDRWEKEEARMREILEYLRTDVKSPLEAQNGRQDGRGDSGR